MTKKYQNFSHRKCEYFPCHKKADPQNFNCLFCYCPLYMLGEQCGGNFVYNLKGYKDCTDCLYPHLIENYTVIVKRYNDIIKKMQCNKDIC